MIRDPLVAEALAALQATFRRAASRERRIFNLSRQLRQAAPPAFSLEDQAADPSPARGQLVAYLRPNSPNL
jgi:hypothetical protein